MDSQYSLLHLQFENKIIFITHFETYLVLVTSQQTYTKRLQKANKHSTSYNMLNMLREQGLPYAEKK